jgi:quercetin dioxygenase-like cupin family protein
MIFMTGFSKIKFRYSLIALTCATIADPAAAHDPIESLGSQIHVVLDKEQSDGEMGMFEIKLPGPGGPPRHIHDDADEAFYMIEGEAEFLVDGKKIVVKEGGAGFAPRGSDHTFRILSEAGGKILVMERAARTQQIIS